MNSIFVHNRRPGPSSKYGGLATVPRPSHLHFNLCIQVLSVALAKYTYLWSMSVCVTNVNCTVYTSVNYDSKGVILFNTMKNRPELYGKFEAYIIGLEPNISAHIQYHYDSVFCDPLIPPLIIEVTKSCLFSSYL